MWYSFSLKVISVLNVLYNEELIAKARALAAEAREKVPWQERNAYCQKRCGLTYQYLNRIGTAFKKPSARTIMNLGYELYVKDLATGEFSKLELEVKCDWNPQNPRMNPTSMPVYVNGHSPTSTTNE